MIRTVLLAWIGAAVVMAQIDPEYVVPKQNPFTSPADLKRGEQLFLGHCAGCHVPKGEGARGPYLARPKLRRAPDDAALFELIRDGIPGTEMPAGWAMIMKEVWQVTGYVRSLGHTAEEKIPGDAARGAALYRTKGNCAQCHAVRGQGGGTLGPDLTEIGTRRSAAYLRAALLEPEKTVPEGFVQVHIVTREGKTITGVRLNEDTFTVQVRDLDGVHSFDKRDLKDFHKDPGKSLMPGYRNIFTAPELDDVVAYLASLRGAS